MHVLFRAFQLARLRREAKLADKLFEPLFGYHLSDHQPFLLLGFGKERQYSTSVLKRFYDRATISEAPRAPVRPKVNSCTDHIVSVSEIYFTTLASTCFSPVQYYWKLNDMLLSPIPFRSQLPSRYSRSCSCQQLSGDAHDAITSCPPRAVDRCHVQRDGHE
jgi:hypothetical protein